MYADGEIPTTEDGKKRRRRFKAKDATGNEVDTRKTSERECPIPKPSGLVGQILGFKAKEGEPLPPVRVEKYTGSIRRTREPKES